MSEVSIIGFTRFSLVIERSLRWFRATRDLSYEEACEKIFSDEKMKVRFEAFENLCLPTYRAFSEATDMSIGVILISKDLPLKWKSKLQDVVSNDQSVKIVELARDADWSSAIKNIIASVAKSEKVFTYRLDDDDALSADLCDVIQHYGKIVDHGDVLSFNDGFQLARYADNHYRVTSRHYPMNAFGIGVYDFKGNVKNIFDLGKHSTIQDRNNVIHDKGRPRWIRVVHPDNDSRTGVIKADDVDLDFVADFIGDGFPHVSKENLASLPIRDITMNTMNLK